MAQRGCPQHRLEALTFLGRTTNTINTRSTMATAKRGLARWRIGVSAKRRLNISAVPIESLNIRKPVATSPWREGMATTRNHMRRKMSEKLSANPVSRADHYATYVRWSDEDACWIGYCPDLFIGGVCHGNTRLEVSARLSILVEDDVRSRIEKGEKLSEPSFSLTETSSA